MVANGQGHVVLPLRVTGDHQAVEPRAVLLSLENIAAKGLRLGLAPAINAKTPSDVTAEDIVPGLPLQFDARVSVVMILGVVGILPRYVLVLIVQILQEIILPHHRIQRFDVDGNIGKVYLRLLGLHATRRWK